MTKGSKHLFDLHARIEHDFKMTRVLCGAEEIMTTSLAVRFFLEVFNENDINLDVLGDVRIKLVRDGYEIIDAKGDQLAQLCVGTAVAKESIRDAGVRWCIQRTDRRRRIRNTASFGLAEHGSLGHAGQAQRRA